MAIGGARGGWLGEYGRQLGYILIMSKPLGGMLKILENCPELELLDVRGCWNVKLEEHFVKKCLTTEAGWTSCCGLFWDERLG